MKLEFNGKVITKNRIVSLTIMSLGIMGLSLVACLLITAGGEGLAFVFPQWFERGLFFSKLDGMWVGGIVTLMALFMLFGRKGSSFSINTHEERSQEYAGERKP